MGLGKKFSEVNAQIRGRFAAFVFSHELQQNERPSDTLDKGLLRQGWDIAQTGGWNVASTPHPVHPNGTHIQRGELKIPEGAAEAITSASILADLKAACIEAYRPQAPAPKDNEALFI